MEINLEFFELQEEAERKRMEALQRKHENRIAHDEEMKALSGKAAGSSKVLFIWKKLLFFETLEDQKSMMFQLFIIIHSS